MRRQGRRLPFRLLQRLCRRAAAARGLRRRRFNGSGWGFGFPQKRAMHAGFSSHVSDAGETRANITQLLAGNAPLIRRPGGVGIRGRHEAGIARADHR